MSDIRVQILDNVAVLTLDRPPVNALSLATYAELRDRLREVGNSESVSVIVLASASKRAFCAGADINEIGQLVGEQAREADEQRQQLARATYEDLLNVAQPTIAAIDGPAIGAGAVVASCCDIRIGTRRASFRLPELDVARCGGGRHMLRHLPQGVVRRMYFTADSLSAEQAALYGLLELVDDETNAFDAALDLARVIAQKSPIALRLGKAALNASEHLSVSAGYAVEQEFTLQLARTHDAHEAISARREGRTPRFTGR
jgi:enoyl-CoA hydratase